MPYNCIHCGKQVTPNMPKCEGKSTQNIDFRDSDDYRCIVCRHVRQKHKEILNT